MYGLCTQGKDEFLGRTICKPMVKLGMSDERTCVLQWHQLTNTKGDAGELLASFELILVSLHLCPPLVPSVGCMLWYCPLSYPFVVVSLQGYIIGC